MQLARATRRIKFIKRLIWTTRDGTRLKYDEMTDQHLRNTVRYLRNKAQEDENAYWGVGSMLQGEMAQYYHEQAEDAVDEKNRQRRLVAQYMEELLEHRRLIKYVERNNG